jgi:uncharacterized membrane protein
MHPFIVEWLNLLLRVAHVLAAIMWIGDSFLFMFMDSRLTAATKPREGDVAGELWMTHSGGFYEVVKLRSLAALPEPLHWFKWESYTTWITGFFLLTVVFYLGGPAALVDHDGPLGHGAAVALSLGLLLGGLGVYQGLCRTPLIESPRAFGVVGLAAVAGLAYCLSHVFTSRAVFLQVGAMLGTIMSSNVLMTIIPAQKKMLAATKAGQPVDTSHGLKAKKRSVHNHYLTLPVLFTMLSNHLPGVYGHRHAWLVLALICVFAVGVKYAMNLRRATHPVIVAGTLGALAGAVGLTFPGRGGVIDPALAEGPVVGFATAQRIVQTRCVTCHSERPADPSFTAPPAGVRFDAPGELRANAERIYVRAYHTKTMPLGNLTGMTEEERRLLAVWIAQGADLEAQDPVAALGRETFAMRCALCHGPEGRGDGPASASLEPKPRDFGDAAWQAATTDEHIKTTITLGGAAVGRSSAMPGHPDLETKPELLEALVQHLRSLKR